MKVILFIGHHKVGSTALQAYLARNAVALLREGILYPAVEPQGQATLLSMAMNGAPPEGTPLPVNLREAHNALAFAMLAKANDGKVPELHDGLPPVQAMFTAIERQIEVFQPHTVILAAEVFANFAPAGPALIRRLAKLFHGADITVTATLRRVDDYLVSWHGQRMRFGHKARPLSAGAVRHYLPRIHFDYRKMLEGWIKNMPGAALRLRSYDEVRAAGGSVGDFFTGFDLPRLADEEPQLNTSLHRGLIEIARRGNLELDPLISAELFRHMLHLGRDLGLPPARDIEMYGPEARALMVEKFTPIHDWLSDTAGRAMFFADVGGIGTELPRPEVDANRIALEALTTKHRATLGDGLTAYLQQMDLDGPAPMPS